MIRRTVTTLGVIVGLAISGAVYRVSAHDNSTNSIGNLEPVTTTTHDPIVHDVTRMREQAERAHAVRVYLATLATTTTTSATTVPASAPSTNSVPRAVVEGSASGRCGGDLPPCSVMECESGGSLTAENPSSSAAGKWQMLIGTSNAAAEAMGRPDLVGVPASQWSEADQDEAARWVLDVQGLGAWEQCL